MAWIIARTRFQKSRLCYTVRNGLNKRLVGELTIVLRSDSLMVKCPEQNDAIFLELVSVKASFFR